MAVCLSLAVCTVSMGRGGYEGYVLGESGLRGESMLTTVAMIPAGSGADLGYTRKRHTDTKTHRHV
jgi:hypothetical protein